MPKVTIVSKITRKVSPYKNKRILAAHKKANAAEKKTYPKEYADMKKVDRKLAKKEYAGEHDSKGNIEISRKVPKRDRPTVKLHERKELKVEKQEGVYKRKK